MKNALIAGMTYFLVLFALGFVLGTIRVMFVAPRFGDLLATFAEVPVMLVAGYFASRFAIRRWNVSNTPAIRWVMVSWFLILLLLFETSLGALLFDRTVSMQLSVLITPAGLVGLSAQVIAALLPLFVGRNKLS